MKQPGKIAIKDNKVYFEPEELKKPNKTNYYSVEDDGYRCNPIFDEVGYNRVIKEYEASKQLIKVRNWDRVKTRSDNINKRKIIYTCVGIKGKELGQEIKNNQPCEAEVTDKAIIMKIL